MRDHSEIRRSTIVMKGLSSKSHENSSIAAKKRKRKKGKELKGEIECLSFLGTKQDIRRYGILFMAAAQITCEMPVSRLEMTSFIGRYSRMETANGCRTHSSARTELAHSRDPWILLAGRFYRRAVRTPR